MTIGKRKLTDKKWSFAILPETVKWDSHNYIALTADDDGFLHVSGNLHVNPLVYFRTAKPLDITTFERVPGGMTGKDEARATYPVFFRGPGGKMYFAYRDGSSGNGNQIYNVWDGKTKTWARVMDKPFTDGEGERNAYLSEPQLGPDGMFHIAWVWRESPDASTNNNPSYARSKDLIHWENSAGKPFALPITLKSGEVIDPIPVGGGIINGNLRIGFDGEKQPVLTYHKYDAKGNLQIYNARREHAEWNIVQVSPDWDYRWDFKGGGSIPFEVRPGGVSVAPDGRLQQSWSHKKFGSGIWYSDPKTLKVVERAPSKPAYPASLTKVQGKFPGLEIRWAGDSGKSGEKGVRYALRWETMGAYRDRPRPPEETPPPHPLRLVKLLSLIHI